MVVAVHMRRFYQFNIGCQASYVKQIHTLAWECLFTFDCPVPVLHTAISSRFEVN